MGPPTLFYNRYQFCFLPYSCSQYIEGLSRNINHALGEKTFASNHTGWGKITSLNFKVNNKKNYSETTTWDVLNHIVLKRIYCKWWPLFECRAPGRLQNGPSDSLDVLWCSRGPWSSSSFFRHTSRFPEVLNPQQNGSSVRYAALKYGYYNNYVVNYERNNLSVCGPGSSVGIATGYGLDGPGSNPGGGETFSPVQTGPGSHPLGPEGGFGSEYGTHGAPLR